MGTEAKTILRLKEDWDVPVAPPGEGDGAAGHFVGREHELDRLANELVRSPHKSILISGYRGVGKTSLVYQALRKARQLAASQADLQGRHEKRFLFVLLNAAQLEAEQVGKGIEPREILVNLIRRLFTAAADCPHLKRTERQRMGTLYKKAVAAEFRGSELHEVALTVLSERERASTTEFALSPTKVTHILWGVGLAVAAVVQALGPVTGGIGKALPFLLAVPIPLTASLVVTLRKRHLESEQRKDSASELYSFDHSLGNLEFDLEFVHREYSQIGLTAIYVIDELDKLDPENVVEVLKYFKNLFTLSSAVFVFVGGEELFARFGQAATPTADFYRAKEYTYFTSKYFLARPGWQDLNAFFDEIVANRDSLEDGAQKQFESLKCAIAFDAWGDYFDAIQRLKDHIVRFDGVEALIEIDDPTPDEQLRAALQKALTVVFEGSYRVETPSRWRENDLTLRGLYAWAHSLVQSGPGASVSDDMADTPVAGAQRDLASFLNRLGVLNVTSEAEQEIRGFKVGVRTYQFTGQPPQQVPESLGFPSEIEGRFSQEFGRFWDLILYFANVERIVKDEPSLDRAQAVGQEEQIIERLSAIGADSSFAAVFRQFWPGYRTVTTSNPPYPYRREDFETWAESLANSTAALRANAAPIFAAIVQEAPVGPGLRQGTIADGAFAEALGVAPETFADVTHTVLSTPDFAKQVLFVGVLDKTRLEMVERAVRKEPRRYRAALVTNEPRTLTRRQRIVEISLSDVDETAAAKALLQLARWLDGGRAVTR